MDTNIFRKDLVEAIQAQGINRHTLALAAQVEKSSLYNFVKGKQKNLSGDNVLRLLPLVYEGPFQVRRSPPQLSGKEKNLEQEDAERAAEE